MKKFLHIFLCLTMALTMAFAGTPSIEAFAAPDWPEGPAVTAEGACLIDANTGTILYGKNMDTPYFPASITKIMTALLVIENCKLDEIVTFSREAVYNVEADSSSLGMDVGDTLSVEDCLYGLMLKSANEVGNALAEHVAGSIEAFADMMNERARELGCTNTNFANPHGLNNPDHHVSPRDMALIAAAAFSNETFVRIDSTRSYKIPPTKRNPDGIYVSCGHRMLKPNDAMYYPGIIGGKTGYTSLAGNTLVTCVERNGLKLVCVVMKDTNPSHYEDTRNLLDFGFANFQSVNVSQNDTSYSFIDNDFTFNGLSATDSRPPIELNKSATITLPMGASFTDTISELTYDLPEDHSPQSIAQITYTYQDRVVGAATLDFTAPARQSFQFAPNETEAQSGETVSGSGEDAPKNGGDGIGDNSGSAAQGEIGDSSGGSSSADSSSGADSSAGTGGSAGVSGSADSGGSAGPSGSGGSSGSAGSSGSGGSSGTEGIDGTGLDNAADQATNSGSGILSSGKNADSSQMLFRILGIGALVLLAGIGIYLLLHYNNERKRRIRYARRMTRLSDLPPSSTLEFDSLLKKRLGNNRRRGPWFRRR